MSLHPDQRQQKIRALIRSASPDQLRAALEAALSATAPAQCDGRDVSDYGIDGWRPPEVVDAEYDGRSSVSDEVDASILAALETPALR
ncbi:hypothetical protein ACF09H_32065 [Streptomyces sp. NPDC014983]|uniref:hypothetical protein n=1 Tax=Streptomyces sp. NPDC014983 TaxID=3364933 RepID=UPI003700BD16